ncbi:hypothetical protein TKK_0006785 [Trichogramma kaykai]
MEVISSRRYEARPSASDSHTTTILVDPDNSVATVKEEEWETRKKKEITTTRQIETRVKRQVVLEDGEVVGDTGPIVTTNTTEDVEQQEHTTQERRTTGDEPLKVDWPSNVKTVGPVVQKELEETVVKSREEVEERVETEDRQHMGDISDEAYLRAVRNNRDGDIRLALAESRRQLAETSGLSKGPRVLAHTTRSNKVIDTEKTLERSELKPEGQIVTERKTTVEHEEIKDDEAPEDYDDEAALEDCGDKELYRKEATQRYLKRRDEDLVDYVSASTGERLGREMRYVSESTEAERTGDWPGQSAEDQQTFSGLRSGSQQDRLYKNGITSSCGPPPPSVPPNHSILNNNNNNNNNLKHRINNNHHHSNGGLHKKVIEVVTESSQNENVARKFETSKWLESHFGSESRSSSEFDEEEDVDVLKSAAKDRASSNSNNNTSFINVTMKSNNVASVEVKTSTSKEQNVVKNHNNNNNNNAKVPTNKAGGGGGFFQGISEWSERYQSIEKQSLTQTKASPVPYYVESTVQRVNGRHSPPPPPTSQHHHQSSSKQQQEYVSSSSNYESRKPPHPERYSPPQRLVGEERTPSPPQRRKAMKEQMMRSEQRSYSQHNVVDSGSTLPPRPRRGSADRQSPPVQVIRERTASPVQVVPRTWESRSRDERRSSDSNNRRRASVERRATPKRYDESPDRATRQRASPESRSPSPRDHRPTKSPSPKSKFGESFRKLVGKLRSGSSERKTTSTSNGKRSSNNNNSNNHQNGSGSREADEGSYLQYNSVDRNVPLGSYYEDGSLRKPHPDRLPKSPRVPAGVTTVNVNTSKDSMKRDAKYRSPSPRVDYIRSPSPVGSGSGSRHHESYKESRFERSEMTSSAAPRVVVDYSRNSPARHDSYRETKVDQLTRRSPSPRHSESFREARYDRSEQQRLDKMRSPSPRHEAYREARYERSEMSSNSVPKVDYVRSPSPRHESYREPVVASIPKVDYVRSPSPARHESSYREARYERSEMKNSSQSRLDKISSPSPRHEPSPYREVHGNDYARRSPSPPRHESSYREARYERNEINNQRLDRIRSPSPKHRAADYRESSRVARSSEDRIDSNRYEPRESSRYPRGSPSPKVPEYATPIRRLDRRESASKYDRLESTKTTTVPVAAPKQDYRESKYSYERSIETSLPRPDYNNGRSASPRVEIVSRPSQEYHRTSEARHEQQQPPLHRYYLGEDPYGNVYEKKKAYSKEVSNSRVHHHRGRSNADDQYSGGGSSTLGRLSKSTSRLASETMTTTSSSYSNSSQTLPRKIHHHASSTNLSSTNNNSSSKQRQQASSGSRRFESFSQEQQQPTKRYGSMVNISFRNNVSPPKTTTTHFVQKTISTEPPPSPAKDKIYKSTLSRSKSFNVEIADDGLVSAPKSAGFTSDKFININNNNAKRDDEIDSLERSKSNGSKMINSSSSTTTTTTTSSSSNISRSNSTAAKVTVTTNTSNNNGSNSRPAVATKPPRPLNKLGETAPLKSPGLLSSLNSRNRDQLPNWATRNTCVKI